MHFQIHLRCTNTSSCESVRGQFDGVDLNTSEGTNLEVSCWDVAGSSSKETVDIRLYGCDFSYEAVYISETGL